MGKTAIVAGATGLIGSNLVELLLESDHYDQIVLIVRTKQNIASGKIIQIIEEDFANIENHLTELEGEDYFCALGTTKAKAGSKEAFEKVDFEYPIIFAKIAMESSRFQYFGIVSAMGADVNSIFFYNKVKGRLEQDLKILGLRNLYIFQPNLLIGERKEFRLGERVVTKLSQFLSFILWRRHNPVLAIEAKTVAKAMFNTSQLTEQTLRTLIPKEIRISAK
ncbi:MAG: hypothetical protein ACI9A7_000289 [Cyclobacteriaceae bacterium]|jgi:uncharacterized protein YbjT (DUF2867 family)